MAAPRLLHVFATFQAAGPQVRTARILNALGAAYRHQILPMDGRAQARGLIDPAVAVELLPPPPKRGSLRTSLALRGLLKRERPDLLLTYNFGSVDALLAARSLGHPPALHHEDGFLPDEVARPKLRRALLRRLALPAAHRVVVVSRGLERMALGPWGQSRERVVYVPNGVDTARFDPASLPRHLRAQLGVPPKAVVVGAVGHLRPEKNLGRLLSACAHARGTGAPLHLLVVGEGPERAKLEAEVAERGLGRAVHFLGHLVDPRPAYGAMDLFALTSDTEQMPVALLEAMAAGLPAVATDVGDVRQVLGPANRALVEPIGGPAEPEGGPSDLDSRLGAHLARLARAPDLRRQLGEENRLRAGDFGHEAMVRAYRSLYEGALSRPPF